MDSLHKNRTFLAKIDQKAFDSLTEDKKQLEIDILHDVVNKAYEKLLSQHEWYIHRNNKKRKMLTKARKSRRMQKVSRRNNR